jgi:katanin p60 ATPase-containing subunit A1
VNSDIPLPGKEGRRRLFDINLKELEVAAKMDWEKLVENTKGYSGADICNLCRDAAYMPMRRKLAQVGGIAKLSQLSQTELLTEEISEVDLLEACKKVRPSVGGEDLKKYAEWMKEFGSS